MWKQIGIIGLGIGASIAVNVGIQHAVKKALSHQRKKNVAREVNIEEDKEFELIANCELVELHQRGGRVKLKSAMEDRRRIFTICNLPTEEGGKRQVVLLFKGVDKDEDLDFSNLDGDFSPKYHNCALTPDHMTIKKMERVPGETPEEDKERFEICIPGMVGKNRYIIKITHLEDPDQRKLVEWLDARSVGFITEKEAEEEEEEEEEQQLQQRKQGGGKDLKEKIKEGEGLVKSKINEKDREIKENLDKIVTGGSGTTKPNTSIGESWHNNTPSGLTGAESGRSSTTTYGTGTGSGLHTTQILNQGGSAYNPVGNTLDTTKTTSSSSGSGYLQVQEGVGKVSEGAQTGVSGISQGAQTAVEGMQQGSQGLKEGIKQAVGGVVQGVSQAMEGMNLGTGSGSSSLPIGSLEHLKK